MKLCVFVSLLLSASVYAMEQGRNIDEQLSIEQKLQDVVRQNTMLDIDTMRGWLVTEVMIEDNKEDILVALLRHKVDLLQQEQDLLKESEALDPLVPMVLYQRGYNQVGPVTMMRMSKALKIGGVWIP